jgi:hypothetical protein
VARFAAGGGRAGFLPKRRKSVNALRSKAKCRAQQDGTDIAALSVNRDRLNDENDSRFHPHSICLHRDLPQLCAGIGGMIARLSR